MCSLCVYLTRAGDDEYRQDRPFFLNYEVFTWDKNKKSADIYYYRQDPAASGARPPLGASNNCLKRNGHGHFWRDV